MGLLFRMCCFGKIVYVIKIFPQIYFLFQSYSTFTFDLVLLSLLSFVDKQTSLLLFNLSLFNSGLLCLHDLQLLECWSSLVLVLFCLKVCITVLRTCCVGVHVCAFNAVYVEYIHYKGLVNFPEDYRVWFLFISPLKLYKPRHKAITYIRIILR